MWHLQEGGPGRINKLGATPGFLGWLQPQTLRLLLARGGSGSGRKAETQTTEPDNKARCAAWHGVGGQEEGGKELFVPRRPLLLTSLLRDPAHLPQTEELSTLSFLSTSQSPRCLTAAPAGGRSLCTGLAPSECKEASSLTAQNKLDPWSTKTLWLPLHSPGPTWQSRGSPHISQEGASRATSLLVTHRTARAGGWGPRQP